MEIFIIRFCIEHEIKQIFHHANLDFLSLFKFTITQVSLSMKLLKVTVKARNNIKVSSSVKL